VDLSQWLVVPEPERAAWLDALVGSHAGEMIATRNRMGLSPF
jgi:hypothetical protein